MSAPESGKDAGKSDGMGKAWGGLILLVVLVFTGLVSGLGTEIGRFLNSITGAIGNFFMMLRMNAGAILLIAAAFWMIKSNLKKGGGDDHGGGGHH